MTAVLNAIKALKLSISPGNRKMGRIPSVSLPPHRTCRPDVPCRKDGCYAMRMTRPCVQAAWERNWQLLTTDSDSYWSQLSLYLFRMKSRYFRYHVGGEIPDIRYLRQMAHHAWLLWDVNFGCWTKQTDVLRTWLEETTDRPQNLHIRWSAWPGDPIPSFLVEHNIPIAWLVEDDRRPANTFVCPGSCETCKHCYDTNDPVSFHRH